MATPDQPKRAQPQYDGWAAVPPGLHTEAQLADLDMPRVPAGRSVAGVVIGDYRRGKFDHYGLYDIADTLPSPASAVQLAAARTPDADARHLCVDCDARTERECALRPRHGRRLCTACAHIADLLLVQAQARADRARHTTWAAELIGDPTVRYIHAQALRGPAADGTEPPVVALRVTVADHEGTQKLDVSVRVGAVRDGVPDDALDRDVGTAKVAEAVHGHRLVSWSLPTILLIRELLAPIPTAMAGDIEYVREPAADWRGDVDPATRTLRPVEDPGRADRLWLLVARMAATPAGGLGFDEEADTAVRERLLTDKRAVHLHLITHHPEAAGRIESVLRALGMTAGPTTVTRGTGSRRVPGAYELNIPVRPDGLPHTD